MSITSVTYWKGGKPEEMVAAAKKAKATIVKHGAQQFQLGRMHSGPEVGQWAAISTFSDWESFGKVQQALANDATYQALLAKVGAMCELTSRRIVVGMDL